MRIVRVLEHGTGLIQTHNQDGFRHTTRMHSDTQPGHIQTHNQDTFRNTTRMDADNRMDADTHSS